MKRICFYFQVHQPYRVSEYSVFDIGSGKGYFSGPQRATNRDVFEKVARKCYLPMNALLLDMLRKERGFKMAFSISGVFIEQCREFGEIGEEVLESFRQLVATKRVELLSETYYHSLSSLYSPEEFHEQVAAHRELMKQEFDSVPRVFRNTELIYSDDIVERVREMGFKGMVLEGWDTVLEWRSPNYLYSPIAERSEASPDAGKERGILRHRARGGTRLLAAQGSEKKFGLLLKNYQLSDDIAFRFGNKAWEGYPLTTDKFTRWIEDSEGDTFNLFMDYETFGEHQWEDTGIFDFMRHLPAACRRAKIGFHTPSEALKGLEPVGKVSVEKPLSWADSERDLSAWIENEMQRSSLTRLFALRDSVLAKHDDALLHEWRRLQTSDHFYYMSTKYWSDGDVHAYFSPFESPYEAYMNFTNVLSDLEKRLAS